MTGRRAFLKAVLGLPWAGRGKRQVSGFSNPLVGGGGALVYPSIHSPNFNIANPPASPAQSWAILRNGLAYLFGVTVSGGTITGPDYIINSQGAFFYSGTPAAGNLIASITSAAGTDAFGNAYLDEVTAYFQGSPSDAVQMRAGGISYYQAAGFAGPWSTIGTISCFLAGGMILSATGGLAMNGPTTVESGDLTISGGHGLSVSGKVTATGGTAASPTVITTDTSGGHAFSNANSWTGTLKYKLMPDNTVMVNGELTPPTGVGNPSNVNAAIGAAYQPASTQQLSAVEDSSVAHLGQALICEMQTSGVIRVYDATAGQGVRIFGRYALDL